MRQTFGGIIRNKQGSTYILVPCYQASIIARRLLGEGATAKQLSGHAVQVELEL